MTTGPLKASCSVRTDRRTANGRFFAILRKLLKKRITLN